MARDLLQTIQTRFFEDDATGEWGISHDNTIGSDESFNAFWDGRGLFHDVWEHNVEHTEYFRGDCAMNQGGEMAAMGALWYYVNELDVFNRLSNLYRSHDEMTRNVTLDPIIEGIKDAQISFGYTLECGVPSQEPVDNSGLDWIIESFLDRVNETPVATDEEFEGARELALTLKNSVTLEKVADLHRWGFRNGQRLAPDNYENQSLLVEFIKFWDKFCKHNQAEELGGVFRGIEFRIYQENEISSWEATFKAQYGFRDVTITSDNPVIYVMDDAYPMPEDE